MDKIHIITPSSRFVLLLKHQGHSHLRCMRWRSNKNFYYRTKQVFLTSASFHVALGCNDVSSYLTMRQNIFITIFLAMHCFIYEHVKSKEAEQQNGAKLEINFESCMLFFCCTHLVATCYCRHSKSVF